MPAHAFNPHAKTFYRPIDAALRWCNLTRYEAQIVQADWSRPGNLEILFPQWPALHVATERILDAVRNGELPYGCLGIPVPLGSYVEQPAPVRRFTEQNPSEDQHPLSIGVF